MPDLDALARKHGGQPAPPGIDLDALAAKHGALVSGPPAALKPLADPALEAERQRQLSRTDLPDDIRNELLQLGEAKGGSNLGALANAYVSAGPKRVVEGVKSLGQGKLSRGTHEVLTGAGVTALPMAVPAIASALVAAPVTTGVVAGAGYLGSKATELGARALGANEDQAALAGDVGAFVGGGAALKLAPKVASAAGAWQAARRSEQGRKATTAFMQAVPPTKSTPYTLEQFNRAVPYLDVEHATKPIRTVEHLRDAADSAITSIESHVSAAVNAHPNDLIHVDVLGQVKGRLARSPRGSAVDTGLRELDDLRLDQPITIKRADAIRLQLNAENRAILKRNNYDVATARQADASFAARESAAEALRDGIYSRLQSRGIEGIRELRRDEGAIIAIRNAAEGQIFNAEKRVAGTGTQATTRRAIGEVTRLVPKVGPYLADRVARPNQTRDELVSKAFTMRIPSGGGQLPAIPPDAPIRGMLPRPAHQTPPAPDTSFVRGKVAVPAVSGRPRSLTEARRVTPLPGEVQPDASMVKGTPAVPIAYDVDPTVKVKAGGVRVTQFSGDPEAARQAMTTPDVRAMLRRMLEDLNTFTPERGRLVRSEGSAVKDMYVHGVAGSPVGDDIRVISEQNVGNHAIQRAIKDLLAGKMPTNRLHTAALDAATGYLEKRPGYRGPVIPSNKVSAEDEGFAAFSKAFDEVVEQPKGTRAVAQRIVNAENAFIEYAMNTAGLSRGEAESALSYMRRGGKRAPLRIDPVGGSFTFSHGSFGDAEAIRRAAALGAKSGKPSGSGGKGPKA